MRVRILGLALAGVVVAAYPAHAGAQKPQITDPVGDANGINQQLPGVGPNPPSVSTAPADLAAADIASVTFATTFAPKKVKGKRVVTGFTVTMALGAAPSVPNVFYRVSATAGGCATNVFFEYSAGGDTVIRCPNADVTKDSTVYSTSPAVVKDKTIRWTVPVKVFPVGSSFASLNAQTRQVTSTPAIGLTAPQYDYASSNATFTLGK